MILVLRQAAIGGFIAAALFAGAGLDGGLTNGSRADPREWVAGGRLVFATTAALSDAYRSAAATGLGLALDAAVEVGVHLRRN